MESLSDVGLKVTGLRIMLILFVGLVLCNFCSGDYAVRCGERDGMSLEEALDGVEGRYKLEWCTQQYYPVANWSWTLYTGDNGHPDNCNQKYFDRHKFYKHSYNMEPINIELNCVKSVCLLTTVDLIFNGTCYKVHPNLQRTKPNSTNTQSCCSRSYFQYVYNNFSKEYFTKSESRVNVYPSGDHVTVDWFLGHIPANRYLMEVCSFNNTVKENCSALERAQCGAGAEAEAARRTRLRCRLRPPRGAYLLQLSHAAPWCSGTTLFESLVHLQHRSSVQPSPAGGAAAVAVGAWGGAAWWAGGALVLGGAAVALLCRPAARRWLRRPLPDVWKDRRAATGEAAGVAAKAAASVDRGKVVLLYARDCAPLMEVARSLVALLVAAGFQVYDVYAAEVCAMAAPAGGEWVRGVLARPDVRVLLLQTPAARCLHTARLRPAGTLLQLEQPLLNRRVMYRRPHAGDALFLLALRLMTDNALTTQNYRKYYIATIESLEVELVAEVTPLQRYSLPAAAALLLRDLAAPGTAPGAAPAAPPAAPGAAPAAPPAAPGAAPAAPPAAPGAAPAAPPAAPGAAPAAPPAAPGAAVARLAGSVAQLHAYIRDKPDYLDDELIFFDYDT